MAVQTGRTVGRWVRFILGDSAGTLRHIPVDRINGVGLDYPEVELSAFMDAVKGVLLDTPSCAIEFEGPWDSTAAAASPALSGSHTVLSALDGALTPRSLDIQFGVRHTWEAGEPQFGITATATAGFILTKYSVDPATMRYSGRLNMFPGSTAPAWGTAAET